MLADQTIAILGAGGFIGSHLVANLETKTGHRVLAVDKTLEKIESGSSRTLIFELDITQNRQAVSEVITSADVVIDLIAYANPSLYVKDPLGTVELNLFENMAIAQQCLQQQKFLVQFSSCEVYGLNVDRNEPFNEDESLLILGPIHEHRWIYSCAKQMLERMIHAYGYMHGLNYVIIRPFNFVGPKIDYLIKDRTEGNPRVFSHFMSALLLNKPLQLVDGGYQRRAYIYIEDSIQALLTILERLPELNRQIINVGNPDNEISIKELAHLMIRLYQEETGLHFSGGTEIVAAGEFYGAGYADCDRRVPDVSKLNSLGWHPKYNLESALRNSIQYYLKHNRLTVNKA